MPTSHLSKARAVGHGAKPGVELGPDQAACPREVAYYYLYVVLDVFSRYVVAWMLAHRESGELATRLFDQAAEHHHIEPGQLTVHSDRGSAPTAKTLAQLYADLGMERSLSRPHVSDDNPFSEAQFKTMKYAPGYPPRFGSYEHARSWCRHFFLWYNTEHRHSGIAYLTPATVHYDKPTPPSRLAVAFSPKPKRQTPSASCMARRRRSLCPQRYGSIRPKIALAPSCRPVRRRKVITTWSFYTKFDDMVSQNY